MTKNVYDIFKDKVGIVDFDGVEIHVLSGSATIEVCLTKNGVIIHTYPAYEIKDGVAQGKKTKVHKKRLKLNVRPLIESRGLSISAFGRLAHIDYRTAYDIVSGKYKRIGLNTIEKIVKALECNINDLFIWE